MKWRDHEDLAKRKCIRLKGVPIKGDFAMLPLKPGDLVKILYGKRWYDGEIMEQWSPMAGEKDEIGKFSIRKYFHFLQLVYIGTIADFKYSIIELSRGSERATISQRMSTSQDPYKEFLQQQAEREEAWKTEYQKSPKNKKQGKKRKIFDIRETTAATATTDANEEVNKSREEETIDYYKKQLRLTSFECDDLKKTVKKLEENSTLFQAVKDVSILN